MPSAKKPAAGRKTAGRGKTTPGAKKPVRRGVATKPDAGEGAGPAAAAVSEAPKREPRARKPGGPTITIVQYASGIQCPIRQKRVLRSLGLRHPRHRVVRPDNPAVRGMVEAIPHLVRIEEVERGA